MGNDPPGGDICHHRKGEGREATSGVVHAEQANAPRVKGEFEVELGDVQVSGPFVDAEHLARRRRTVMPEVVKPTYSCEHLSRACLSALGRKYSQGFFHFARNRRFKFGRLYLSSGERRAEGHGGAKVTRSVLVTNDST